MGTKEVTENAECRGCRMELRGTPYYMGGSAYHPITGEMCKVNFYGGYVCSESCDRRSSQELEDTMPGHDSGGSLSCHAKNSLNDNWEE